MPRLTKRIVDAAPVREAPYFIWCSDLPGFGVRVHPSGRRVYYADYRNQEGARKRMSLGQHGKVTTEEARKLAIATLGEVVRGEDPAEERATRRKAMTVKQLCDAYLLAAKRGLIRGKRGGPKKMSTLATDRGRIARHIVPLIGRRKVRDLTPPDIYRLIRDITAGKTAMVEKTVRRRGKSIVTGGAGTAARCAGLLGGMLTYAVQEGIIPSNPAHGVKRPSDQHRTRRLTEEEYARLGAALRQSADIRDTDQGIAAVWLLALTGCRAGEVRRLRWDEVDEAGKCFRLIDSKEGASVRPIGGPAFDVLAAIEREDGNPYVLTAVRGEGAYGGLVSTWRRIRKRADLEDVNLHTLRHSFASVAADLGYAESTIAALLGHAAGSVTSRYVHHLDSVLIAAADKAARQVLEYMERLSATIEI